MTERVTVEVGGFASGVYHTTRLTKYDEAEKDVEAEAEAAFKATHGEPSGFGQYATSTASDDVPTYKSVLVEVGGYMRGGRPVRGYMAHRWRRVEYEPRLAHESDKTRDTRGGERRRRWL